MTIRISTEMRNQNSIDHFQFGWDGIVNFCS